MQLKSSSAFAEERHTKLLFRVALTIGLGLFTFSGVACGGEASDGVDTSLDTPTTRIRTVEKMQAVFDLVPKSAHDDMMEMMGGPDSIKNGDAHHGDHTAGGHHDHSGDSHFVMLTLMDPTNRGAAITDADVSFRIKSPANQELAQGGHVMSGKGMHHYAVGFVGKEKGEYTVEAQIQRGGATHTQTVRFEIGE